MGSVGTPRPDPRDVRAPRRDPLPFGMYDYYHDQTDGFLSASKHTRVWWRFLRFVRGHYPREGWIYLIKDNLSTHRTPTA